MSNNKTISISPHLFQINAGRGRTRKASKEKKAPVVIPPIVSPNLLKKKLIQRLKNHKARETKDLAPQVVNTATKSTAPLFIDEFNDSINYLQSLSSQKSAADRKSEVQRRTLKKHFNDLNGIIPDVSLNLPEELSENALPSLSSGLSSMSLKTDVPYGVLKNGSKPTFREYRKTLRNVPSILQSQDGGGSIREKKLDNLRRKLDEMKKRKLSSLETNTPNLSFDENISSISQSSIADTSLNDNSISETDSPAIEEITIDLDEINEQRKQEEEKEKLLAQPVKQMIKTIKSTQYTLGKKPNERKVAVLLKNRSTRKKVMDACKKIKQEDIKNVKDYLKTHNFIKTGSTAPNHLYREMFKSLMLTGNSINTNKDTLLQNFAAGS